MALAFPDADEENDDGRGWLYRGVMRGLEDSLNVVKGSEGYLRADIRTKRKLRTNDDSLWMVLDQDASGINVTYNLFVRTLCQLP